jgi:hypothetical protein
MKKIVFVVLLLLSTQIFGQWNVSASMGLDFKSSPSFRDYINYCFPSTNQIPTFKSAVAFGFETDYKLNKSFAMGIEYNLQIDSYNTSTGVAGIYEISYLVHRPTLLAYYVIPGDGYQFKFGGGLGYRYVALQEKKYSTSNYTANGFGLLLKAEGNTKLANNLFALIGTNLRYDYTGDVSSGSNKIVNTSTGANLNLNSISFGIYLGITTTF